MVLRIPYPTGFYTKWMDGRIDDPKGGWKGTRPVGDDQHADAVPHGDRQGHDEQGLSRATAPGSAGKMKTLIQGVLSARALYILICIALAPVTLAAQQGTTNGEWRTYGGDLGGTRYAPLDQINAATSSSSQIAWRFKTDNLGPRPDFNLQTTPLMVERRALRHGRVERATRWRSTPRPASCCGCIASTKASAPQRRRASCRAAASAYWTDGTGDERIFYVTIGYQLVGAGREDRRCRCAASAQNGVVDLKQDDDQELDPITGEIGLNAAPVVAKNVVDRRRRASSGQRAAEPSATRRATSAASTCGPASACGSSTPFRSPASSATTPGENDSWSYTGNTGVWAQITVDEELEHRLPAGRDADRRLLRRPSARATTCSPRAWSRSTCRPASATGTIQLVHHGIWDYDIPCAPILADITVNGRPIKAVAQPTKQGFLYVFDRETGQPVWPIEERPVEKGTVPRRMDSPTQPFPTKPPPFERQGFAKKTCSTSRRSCKAEALKVVQRVQDRSDLHAADRRKAKARQAGLLYVPNGANWPGGSFDPETGMLYIYSHTLLRRAGRWPNDPKRSDMELHQRRRRRCGRRRGGGGLDRAGAAADQAALGPHHARSISTRVRSSGRSRTARRRTRSRTIRRLRA